MDPELKRFEEELERFSPRRMPEGLIARMEAAMDGWGSRDDHPRKVVSFPVVRRAVRGSGRAGRGMWAAAAGVALLGCAAGLLVSGPKRPGEETAATASRPGGEVLSAAGIPTVDREKTRPAVFDPQAARRRIVRAADQGVVATGGRRPMRLMRIEYVDRVVFRNPSGEEVHVERPAVKYVLIPVSTD